MKKTDLVKFGSAPNITPEDLDGSSYFEAAWKALWRHFDQFETFQLNDVATILLLPRPWQVIYFVGVYDAQVSNGGLDQFFFNEQAGHDETLEALREIPAEAHARVFQRGLAIQEGKNYRDRRKTAIATDDLALALQGGREEWYERLDRHFFKLAGLDSRLNHYIKRNAAMLLPNHSFHRTRANSRAGRSLPR
ncbi:MAG: DUF4375 domain-containing protein [Rhodocyclaceae bacterium]|nr:DUF4375 domain-containing protein [Rhodocyclaceae bacterium]